ncbi:MAG: hypothetical protein AUJ98_03750 [Bacteroidetes bacterium CG2_30_33_31]|nr:MAG: hypothetical protein AUJ98_03750 [Bacteroidetes bacterium CG2_30_33_31]
MKNPIFILAVTAIIAGTMFNSCQSSATKVENAEEDLQVAKENVDEADMKLYQERQDSIKQFKNESKEKIDYYDARIIELKAKIANKKTNVKTLFESRLALIEEKNNELKIKLAKYSDDTSDNWKVFKSELSRDMENLEKALNDFSKDNVK